MSIWAIKSLYHRVGGFFPGGVLVFVHRTHIQGTAQGSICHRRHPSAKMLLSSYVGTTYTDPHIEFTSLGGSTREGDSHHNLATFKSET